MQNRCEHTCRIPVRKMHERLLKAIAVEVAKLEAVIAAMIKASAAFCRNRRDHRERAGTWQASTSAGLIAEMPELGQVSNEAVSPCWASRLTMTIAANGGASARSRADAARSAICSTWLAWELRPGTIRCSRPSIDRLIAKGKKKKVALVACMRKLIVILNIMIARRREMGCQSLRGELDERAKPRSAFGRAPADPTDR